MTIFSYIHIASALTAYGSAFAIFTRRVGGAAHTTIGITYCVAMLATAISGLFIYASGGLSIFHAFSVLTIVTISRGWLFLRAYRKDTSRKDLLKRHYFNMAYSFMGLNLAALAQATRFLSFNSFSEYLTTLGLAYLVAITAAVYLIRKVLFRRFAPWFQNRGKMAAQ